MVNESFGHIREYVKEMVGFNPRATRTRDPPDVLDDGLYTNLP